MMKRLKWILIVLVLAGVAAAAVAASMAESSIEVEMAAVDRGELREGITEEGQTRLRDRHVVAAPVGGLLARIELEEGSTVAAGDVIAHIYPAPESEREVNVARARVAAASARRRGTQAQVEELQARLAQQEQDLERHRRLVSSGAMAPTQIQGDALAVSTLREQIRSARAASRAASADVTAARRAIVGEDPRGEGAEAVEVRAPTAGTILRVIERSERVIPPGTPLLALGDPSSLEVVVEVLSEDAVRVEAGDVVLIDGWGGDEQLSAHVRLVEPEAFTEVSALGVEEQRVRVIADIDSPPQSLGSGYRVQASIVLWSGADVLRVPTSALFQREGGWHAFAVSSGHASLREVDLDHRSAEYAEVVAGLEDGAEVVLFPSDEVEDGVAVHTVP